MLERPPKRGHLMAMTHRTGRASLIVGATFSAALVACVGELAHVDAPVDGVDGGEGGAGDGAAESGHPADASADADAGPGIVVLKTDTSWRLAAGGNASVVSAACTPSVWVAPRENAAWIWSAPCTATDTESETFSATFNLGAF